MGKRLYVGNLSFGTTEEGLRSAFAGATSVKLILDRETGRSRGFGFVEFGTEEEAQAAIQAWDGRDLDGRNLRVNEAEDRPNRGRGGPPPDHGGGGRKGGRGGGRGSRRRRDRDDHGHGYD